MAAKKDKEAADKEERETRTRLLNTLPNHLRATVIELERECSETCTEFHGGAITGEQLLTFQRLINRATRLLFDPPPFAEEM